MCRQFDSGPRHRTKSAITSMTEPALAMLAGGVTMRPPSRHRWDGTDLLASRSCGPGCSSLAHSDWQSLRPAEIRATRCLSKTVPARRSWCTSSARIRPATAVSSCSLERRRLVIGSGRVTRTTSRRQSQSGQQRWITRVLSRVLIRAREGQLPLDHSDHAGHNRVLIGIAHADRAREERWLRAPIHSMEIDADPRAELEHKS